MDPLRTLGKLFIFLGVMMAGLGAVLYFGGRLPFRLGQLPGDIVYRGRNTTLYVPIVTCLLLSAVITLLSWLLTMLKK
jgi:hypothetical protein